MIIKLTFSTDTQTWYLIRSIVEPVLRAFKVREWRWE